MEAIIEWVWRFTWRTWWRQLRDALGGIDQESVELLFEDIIERDWTRSHGRSMGGWPGNGDQNYWLVNLQLWGYNEVTIPCSSHREQATGGWPGGRNAGSWSYTRGSPCNCANEWMTGNLGWMLYLVYTLRGVCCTWYKLYLVYAVLGVNSWWWHGVIERDDLTLCFAMMVELGTKERVGGQRWEWYGGYE